MLLIFFHGCEKAKKSGYEATQKVLTGIKGYNCSHLIAYLLFCWQAKDVLYNTESACLYPILEAGIDCITTHTPLQKNSNLFSFAPQNYLAPTILALQKLSSYIRFKLLTVTIHCTTAVCSLRSVMLMTLHVHSG